MAAPKKWKCSRKIKESCFSKFNLWPYSYRTLSWRFFWEMLQLFGGKLFDKRVPQAKLWKYNHSPRLVLEKLRSEKLCKFHGKELFMKSFLSWVASYDFFKKNSITSILWLLQSFAGHFWTAFSQ